MKKALAVEEEAYELYPLGEGALVVRWPGGIEDQTREKIDRAVQRLGADRPPAVTEWVRAYTTLTVFYDPWFVHHGGLSGRVIPGEEGTADADASPYERMSRWVRGRLDEAEAIPDTPGGPAHRTVVIPACFGGLRGPDLHAVASGAGMRAEEAVRLFCSAEYTVHLIGFMPGFPYLGGLPPELAAPRRAQPRIAVPAGSIGIAGRQSGIYPVATPGGWQLIGQTPLRLFDPDREAASLLQPGDRVRFEPVPEERYAQLERQGKEARA